MIPAYWLGFYVCTNSGGLTTQDGLFDFYQLLIFLDAIDIPGLRESLPGEEADSDINGVCI